MSLSRNVIRELPAGSFQMFKNLLYLDLSGNSLAIINSDMFAGLENSLMELRIGQNKITNIGNAPLRLSRLRKLDMSHNNIVDIPRDVFDGVNQLVYLNLSHNNHLAPIPVSIVHSLNKLQTVDFSNTGMKSIFPEMFAKSPNLKTIVLRNNKIQELLEGTFSNMRNLTFVDLSFNIISKIQPATFINAMNIKQLNLRGNQLTAFMGENFNTGTSLEELDISDNQITYLSATSFRIHPRLINLIISQHPPYNRYNF
jgi:Leucine-rich repeat (LRR) protein